MAEATAYHESDLDLEEHYTDSHNYTESDFATFEMVGMPLYAAFPAGAQGGRPGQMVDAVPASSDPVDELPAGRRPPAAAFHCHPV